MNDKTAPLGYIPPQAISIGFSSKCALSASNFDAVHEQYDSIDMFED